MSPTTRRAFLQRSGAVAALVTTTQVSGVMEAPSASQRPSGELTADRFPQDLRAMYSDIRERFLSWTPAEQAVAIALVEADEVYGDDLGMRAILDLVARDLEYTAWIGARPGR